MKRKVANALGLAAFTIVVTNPGILKMLNGLAESGMRRAASLLGPMARWRRKGRAVPLDSVERSTESEPGEITETKTARRRTSRVRGKSAKVVKAKKGRSKPSKASVRS
jgi:hypothetical protein